MQTTISIDLKENMMKNKISSWSAARNTYCGNKNSITKTLEVWKLTDLLCQASRETEREGLLKMIFSYQIKNKGYHAMNFENWYIEWMYIRIINVFLFATSYIKSNLRSSNNVWDFLCCIEWLQIDCCTSWVSRADKYFDLLNFSCFVTSLLSVQI